MPIIMVECAQEPRLCDTSEYRIVFLYNMVKPVIYIPAGSSVFLHSVFMFQYRI